MFWIWSSGRGRSGFMPMFLGMALFFIVLTLLSGRGITWIWWFILPTLFFSVLPAVLRSLNRNYEIEKRKRDDDLYSYEEKPKREPVYRLGDDGELIEVTADDEKPKRENYL